MPRQRRHTPAGMAFHVINRGVGRQTLFHKDEDYAAFERVLTEAWQKVPLRILAYCLMPNEPQGPAELEAIRRSVNRGCPFGEDAWQKQVAEDLGLEQTLRPRGRPPKAMVEPANDP